MSQTPCEFDNFPSDIMGHHLVIKIFMHNRAILEKTAHVIENSITTSL